LNIRTLAEEDQGRATWRGATGWVPLAAPLLFSHACKIPQNQRVGRYRVLI